MNTTLDKISHKAQRAAASVIIDKVLAMVDKDRETGFLELVDWAEQFWGNGFSKEDYDKVRTAIKDPDNRWIKFINRVLDETDPHVAKMAALNLGFEAFFRGTKMIRKNREIYHCNIPWLILFDPTSACNMHCQGCWSGTYGHKANLSFDDMDKIITEGKELGVYLYMMTGGEPLVRKADILRLAEKHNDREGGQTMTKKLRFLTRLLAAVLAVVMLLLSSFPSKVHLRQMMPAVVTVIMQLS